MNKTALLIVSLGALLAASIGLAAWSFIGQELQITWQGWLAMGLGAGLSIALGAGLMALVFFSARHGHDDVDHEL
ncbi:hypothetical protein F1654_06080 [Alkalicaulis satelles]|uniref:Uncharacterized protein n=1 Tax=Alkalicaulis satelles TaxID=2609175 RepID=A0A5M6ZGN6_9PROT|nr:hypothetical protein [Alkalicaulis satelles]KAA5803375.1 hypothetical protein F1654_06080 [Alkalicaulis satelles]